MILIPRLCVLAFRLGTAIAASHPPMRSLPADAVRFSDPPEGDNAPPGTREHPWKTPAFAVKQLRPGGGKPFTVGLHGRIDANGRAFAEE